MFLKLQPLDESNFWQNTEKFIFIATRPASMKEVGQSFTLFNSFRILNAITIVPQHEYFRVFSYNSHLEGDMPMYEIDNMETNTSKVFEDKLRNLYGYSYKLVGYNEPFAFPL